ncbi:MAG: phosphoribosylaminoimidazolesuccinocarboxamide synthase [Bacteroidales bacterium]|nr:phosphoribosylaminoimidazolesuccinocarboxamide synthase [Bacteroidales bacterium]
MMKKELILNGNEKQIFATDDPDKVIVRYKDVTVAFNNVKRARFEGKGALDNQISALLLGYLGGQGVPNHFLERIGENEQLCRKIEIIPIEFIVRNRVAGSLAARLGIEEGFQPDNLIVELRYNDDELDDPFINPDLAVALGLVNYEEVGNMIAEAKKANSLLKGLFHQVGIELVDVKIEFGRATDNGQIILSDEISPDTARLWDERTGERLDKDRFRLDLSDVVASYRNVYERLTTVLGTN